MSSAIDKRSASNLIGVHADLVMVIKRAFEITHIPFVVIEGVRTIERQQQLVARGASRTMNSRHLTGHAVDIVPLDENGVVSWDWPLYYQIASVIKDAARQVGVPIEWGGDWKSFKDGPHWQLPWSSYPHDANKHLGHETSYPRSDKMSRSRTVIGSTAATAGGAAVLADGINQAISATDKAKYRASDGTTFGIVIGVVIIIGACLAIYARWDDAGRPRLWGRK